MGATSDRYAQPGNGGWLGWRDLPILNVSNRNMQFFTQLTRTHWQPSPQCHSLIRLPCIGISDGADAHVIRLTVVSTHGSDPMKGARMMALHNVQQVTRNGSDIVINEKIDYSLSFQVTSYYLIIIASPRLTSYNILFRHFSATGRCPSNHIIHRRYSTR